MTNKEAIRVLKAIKEHPSMSVYLPDEYEALDLAIDALKYVSGETSFSYDEKWLAAQNKYKSEKPDADEWRCNGAL